MTFTTLLSLAVAMALFGASPGPGIFAVVSRALSTGFGSAMLLTVGLVAGDLLWLTLAASGLGMVAEMMGDFFIVLKIGGGLYLAWMGVKAWRAPAVGLSDDEVSALQRPSALGTLASGLAVTLSNPKAILFYMAILPTLLDLDTITPTGLVLAGAVVAVVLTLVCAAYAFLASRARRVLQSPQAAPQTGQTSAAIPSDSGWPLFHVLMAVFMTFEPHLQAHG
ncbi:LysE family translocator [Insolitispirillum peregrinum]